MVVAEGNMVGVGVKVSTLGLGVEAATAVTEHSNVRAGFNGFNYDHERITITQVVERIVKYAGMQNPLCRKCND